MDPGILSDIYCHDVFDDDQEKQPEVDDCPICWEPLETALSETECKHKFHTKCLCTSVRRDHLCPMCRRSLIQDNISTKSHVDVGRFHLEVPNISTLIWFPFFFLVNLVCQIAKFICMQTLLIIIMVLHVFFVVIKIVVFLISIPVSLYIVFLASQSTAILVKNVIEEMHK